MASFLNRNGKWYVQIRRKGFPSISKTFFDKSEAEEFAAKVELTILNDDDSTPSPFALPVSKKELEMMYKGVARRSAMREWTDTLTYEEFLNLFHESKGKCSVSGIYFSGSKINESRSRPYFPSIDRIEAKKGYTKDNVRFVCCAVNMALSDYGDEVLKQIAFGIVSKTVLNHQNETNGHISKEGRLLVLPSQKGRS